MNHIAPGDPRSPHPESATPTSVLEPRRSARAVLLDEDGRLLLLHGPIAEGDARTAWYSPGGRLEPGESFVEAVKRELHEELGLYDAPIGAHVWTRQSTRRRGGVAVPALAHFFLVRVSHFEPDLSRIGPSEANVTHRWWTLDELHTTTDLLLPQRLPELVEDLINGRVPAVPIDAS